MHGSKNDTWKFFQKIKRKSGASFCKDQDGNMVTNIKSSLELWRAHFNSILNGDDTDNPANEMLRTSRPNTLNNTTPVAPPGRSGYDHSTV